MSRCFTWFPIGVLGEPNIYHDSGVFYKNVGILLGGGVWLWRISGGFIKINLYNYLDYISIYYLTL